MRKEEAIKFYGSQSALALALGIAQASVAGWKEYPPYLRQVQIEHITGGALKAGPQPAQRKKARKQVRAG